MRLSGSVSKYSPARNFGFIRFVRDSYTEEIFFHKSSLQEPWCRRLLDGLPCTFEIGERNGRPIAINIQIVQAGDVPGNAGQHHEQ